MEEKLEVSSGSKIQVLKKQKATTKMQEITTTNEKIRKVGRLKFSTILDTEVQCYALLHTLWKNRKSDKKQQQLALWTITFMCKVKGIKC